MLAGGRSVHDASATGDSRTLSFHHTHSGEDLTITFKRNGRYDDEALKQLNHFLRDWRTQDATTMDRHLFDILWEVYRDVGGKQPIQIISSYRSPATNAMLRRRSAHSGVARFSQHMLGHAMDFYIPGVPLEEIRFAGLRLQRGGVGFYPTSGSPFVHLDTGNVRHWPRMTREQLVRLFPNGRTVHVPSDGRPLPGYELALAEIHHRAADGDAGEKPSVIASLFGGKAPATDDDEEGGAPDPAGPAAKPSTVIAVAQAGDEAVPLPRAKPADAFQLAAAAASKPAPAPAPVAAPAPVVAPAPVAAAAAPVVVAAAAPAPAPAKLIAPVATPARAAAPTGTGSPKTPADIINARGFWGDGDTAKPQQATPAQVAALAARNAFASADPPSTASVPQQALAYGPQLPAAERARVVTASLAMPRGMKVSALARDAVASFAKSRHEAGVTTATRLAPANNTNSIWMRAMIVTPSTSRVAMLVTALHDDVVALRQHFVKPQTTVAMSFSDDPTGGISCERFSGAAVAQVSETAFAQTATLR